MRVQSQFIALLLLGSSAACSASAANSPVTADTKPLADQDEDGVPDNLDQCPNEAEDYDGYLDEDGCPDYDNSHSGEILDIEDRCPIVLDCEVGFVDYDGCPEIKLEFELNSIDLPVGHIGVIDELAEEIKTGKKVVKLRIDGHFGTGEVESLARARSETVRDLLVARQVHTAMLEIGAYKAPEGSTGFISFFPLKCAR